MRLINWFIIRLAPPLRRLRSDSKGVVAVVIALTIPVLAGLAALAVDTSVWSSTKNSAQGAADAAVLSAVVAAAAGSSSNQIVNEANASSALGGFTNGQNGVTVAVNNPPTSGPNTSDNTAYEVIIRQPQTRFFAGVLGAAPTISGRSVARVASKPACLLSLAPSGIGVSLVNSVSIGATNCTVAANSSSGSAASLVNSSTLTAANLNVVGNYTTANSSRVVTPPTIIKTSAPVTKDPYGCSGGSCLAVPAFSTSPCSPKLTVTNSATRTITQGCYNGISVSNSAQLTMSSGTYIINGGGGINVANGSTLTMGPGIYIINGGSFSLANSTTTTASQVSIVLTNTPSAPGTPNWGSVSFVNSTNFTLTPPTSGAFQGVAFYMDRNAPAITDTFANSSSTSLTGSLYFPSQPVIYANSSSAGPACLQLIALTVSFANAASFGVNCGSLIVPGLQPTGKKVPVE